MTLTVPEADGASCERPSPGLGGGPPDELGEAGCGRVSQHHQGGELSVWTDQRASHCVLRLRGRLTSGTVSLLETHVDALGCSGCEEVVLDLSGVTLLDEVGASLIVGLGHYVAGRGGRFSLNGVTEEAGARLAAAEVELS